MSARNQVICVSNFNDSMALIKSQLTTVHRGERLEEHSQAKVGAVEPAAAEVVLHQLVGNLPHHRTKHQG